MQVVRTALMLVLAGVPVAFVSEAGKPDAKAPAAPVAQQRAPDLVPASAAAVELAKYCATSQAQLRAVQERTRGKAEGLVARTNAEDLNVRSLKSYNIQIAAPEKAIQETAGKIGLLRTDVSKRGADVQKDRDAVAELNKTMGGLLGSSPNNTGGSTLPELRRELEQYSKD